MVVHNDVRRDARVLKEARTLSQAGHDVTVFGLAEEAKTFTVHDGAVTVQLVERTKARREHSDVKRELLSEASRIARDRGEPFREPEVERVLRSFLHQGTLLARTVLDRGTAKAVHLHDHVALTAAPLYAEEMGVPLVWDAHEIYEELAGVEDARRIANPAIISANQKRVDGFVTINDAIAHYYADRYPDLPKAIVLPNAASARENSLPSYDGRLHVAANLPRDRRILLFQGGLSPHRGIDALLEAAPRLPPDWSLVFMGWGPLADQIDEVAARTAMEDGTSRVVRIDGAEQAELPLWTAGATLGAIPYENTSLNHLFCTPNKLWEYPIAGVPILASDLEELGRAVRDHHIGVLVPRDFTASDIERAISALTDEDISALRDACGTFVRSNNWEVFENRLVEVYSELPTGGRGRNVPPARMKRTAKVAREVRRVFRKGTLMFSSSMSFSEIFRGGGRDQRLLARIEKLENANLTLTQRNASLKDTVSSLREKVRSSRVDTREVDPLSHNSAEVMDSFFDGESERAESSTPYIEFASALRTALKAHGLELEGKNIFDAGLGNGEMLRALTEGVQYRSISGMDFSKVGVERARTILPDGEFEVGDLMEPIDGEHEVVVCTEVLEHIPRADTALTHVLQAIAPGGVAILTVPDGRVDYSRFHINFWSPESWRTFVTQAAEGLDCTFDTFRVRPTALYEQNLAIVRKPTA